MQYTVRSIKSQCEHESTISPARSATLVPRAQIGTFLQPVKLSGARERVAKKSYIRLPKFPSPAMDKAYAETKADKSWTVFENTTSGHMIMINEPEWLTEVLLKAA